MRKKLNIGFWYKKSLAWKFSAWLVVWFAIALFTWHFDHINIRAVMSPDDLADQLYSTGSAYISLKTILAVMSHLTAKGIFYHLLLSGIVTTLAVSVYIIAKEKYSDRVAVLTSAIAGTQAYLLLSIGTINYALISVLALPVILLLCSWLHPKHGKIEYLLLGLTIAVLFSVPYFWLILFFALIVSKSRLKILFKHISKTKKILLIIPSLISIALASSYSIKRHDYQWLIGDMNNLKINPNDLLDRTWEVLKRIFIDFDPTTAEKLPLIGVALILLSAMSVYLYIQGFSSIQQKTVLFACALAFVVTSAGLVGLYFVILSGAIIMSVNGVAMLLQQWFTVFPKNPFARSAGIVLFTLAVLTIVITQIISYIELTKLL
ncbi:MAG: hypothetical protein AAB914_03345 [Patescibacteria group bacterium]